MGNAERSLRKPIDQIRGFQPPRKLSRSLPMIPVMEERIQRFENTRLVESIVKAIPQYTEFKTGDELQANGRQLAIDFTDHVESGFLKVHKAFGTSTEGKDIDLIEIGRKDAKRTVMWVGTPHPNEAVGTLAIDFLSRYLCEHPEIAEKMDTKFVFIPNADPDGLELNKSWLKGEMDPLKYALGYYRPPFEEQVDWAFPIDYKNVHFDNPPSEVQTLIKAFSLYKPEFFYSLHNGAFRNSFFLLSNNMPSLLFPLQQIIIDQDLALQDERPESPWHEAFAKGINKISTIKTIYDYYSQKLTKVSLDGWGGAKSSEYLLDNMVPDALSLESEVSYFTADALKDNTPSGITKREAVFMGTEKMQKIYDFMEAQYNQIKSRLPDSRLKRVIDKRIEVINGYIAAINEESKKPEYDTEATKAYVYNEIQGNSFMEVVQLGQVYQLALSIGEDEQAEQIKEYIENEFAAINEVSEIKAVPLQKLVAIQVAAGLMTQQHLALAA